MMKTFITGGAGFIASHLEDVLIKAGCEVCAADVTEPAKCHNIMHLMDNGRFTYQQLDVTDVNALTKATADCDVVYHLAANSDIRRGGQDPAMDYTMTFQTTRAVLEAVRVNCIPKMFFSSTSAVYGDIKGSLNELTGGLKPISYYGAAKLSSEAMISAYSYMNDFDALVFRFPNVIGPRLTHGVIFDFLRKLKQNPKELEILGNGKQNKQYVYVTDLVRGIWEFSQKKEPGLSLYNVSTESYTDVNTIADLVCERLGLKDVKYSYTGGNCGWKGDVSSFGYDISKAKAAGWKYRYSSTEAVRETLRQIDAAYISSL